MNDHGYNSLPEKIKLNRRLLLTSEAYLIQGKLIIHRFYTKEQADLIEKIKGIRIFISYAHQNKDFVMALVNELNSLGLDVWFDQWEILAGESIPEKLSQGSRETDFMLVIFSKASQISRWQQKEWEAKFIDEINTNKVSIIPIKIEECEIPQILKTKQYINFINTQNNKENFSQRLTELLRSLSGHIKKRETVIKINVKNAFISGFETVSDTDTG